MSEEILLSQGAEALVYKTRLLPETWCIRKHRPRKTYRHAILDAKLTRHRVLSESRVLQKCRKLGLRVPAVLFLREDDIYMEFIDGISVRQFLFDDDSSSVRRGGRQRTEEGVMRAIGESLAALHGHNVVHGDLTTSNLLVTKDGTVWMIDFGLSATSLSVDDKAVDLYVLERAFLSTHPSLTHLFQLILLAYHDPIVLKKLSEVRMRGRKRTMVG